MQGGGTEPPTKPKGRPRKVRPGEQVEISSPISDLSRNGDSATAALDLRARVINSLNSNLESVSLS